MRTPKENIYYTLLAISVEGLQKTIENVRSLFTGKK
jgi:hypothetical protein